MHVVIGKMTKKKLYFSGIYCNGDGGSNYVCKFKWRNVGSEYNY
jgi:hypothetical protein